MNPNLLYKIALKKYEKASKAIDSLTKDVAGVFPDYDNKRALISFDCLNYSWSHTDNSHVTCILVNACNSRIIT